MGGTVVQRLALSPQVSGFKPWFGAFLCNICMFSFFAGYSGFLSPSKDMQDRVSLQPSTHPPDSYSLFIYSIKTLNLSTLCPEHGCIMRAGYQIENGGHSVLSELLAWRIRQKSFWLAGLLPRYEAHWIWAVALLLLSFLWATRMSEPRSGSDTAHSWVLC